MIRLFVPDDLAAGSPVTLSAAQAHYLRDVMRRATGDDVALFNGRDGEWLSAIASIERKAVGVIPKRRTREQTPGVDLELVVGLVKRARLETIVEKATELGVHRIRLAVTRFTQAERTNVERLTAIAVEAAEQTGRLDVPEVMGPAKLEAILKGWPADAHSSSAMKPAMPRRYWRRSPRRRTLAEWAWGRGGKLGAAPHPTGHSPGPPRGTNQRGSGNLDPDRS